MRRFAKVLAWFFAAVVVLLGAIAIFLNNFDWNRAKPFIEKHTGVRIAGDLEVRLGVHPIVTAEDVSVHPVFRAGRVKVHGEVWPLLKRRVEIPYFELVKASIDLDAEMPKRPGQDEKDAPREEPKEGANFKFILGLAHLDTVSLESQGFAAHIERFDIRQKGDAHFVLDGKARVNDLAATLGGDLRGDDFDLHGRLGDAKLAARGSLPARDLARLDAHVEAEGEGLHEIFAAFGLPLSDALAPFFLATRIHRDGDAWLADDFKGGVGKSRLAGNVRFEPSTPPKIAVTARSSYLNFADFGPFMPKTVAEEMPPAKLAEQEKEGGAKRLFTDAPLPGKASLSGIDLKVDADVARFEGPDKAKIVEAFKVKVALGGGKIDVKPLWMKVAGGELETALVYDASGETPHADLTSTMKRVSVGPLAGIFFEDGITAKKIGNVKIDEILTGTIGGKLAVKGDGPSFRAMMGSLDGDVALGLQDGKMSGLVIEALGMDVTESIGTLLAKKQTTTLDCVLIDLDAKDGLVKPDVMLVSTADSDVMMTGTMSLKDETLDVVLKTEPKDFSLGSFRTPITVKGPMTEPRVDVDRSKAAARLLAAIGLGAFMTPAAALIPLIETGLGKDGRCHAYVTEIAKVKGGQLPAAH